MKTIHKHKVEPGEFVLTLPRDAEFLSVQTQHRDPQSWWLLDPKQPVVQRSFVVRATGYAFTVPDSEAEVFLGTFQLYDGGFVGHLFEVLR
jgi:hypothetical protein